MQLAIIPSIWK